MADSFLNPQTYVEFIKTCEPNEFECAENIPALQEQRLKPGAVSLEPEEFVALLSRSGVKRLDGRLLEMAKHLMGDGTLPFNMVGVLISGDTALIKDRTSTHFTIAMMIGAEWIAVAHVSAHDETVAEMMESMVVTGPTPTEREHHQRRVDRQQAYLAGIEKEKAEQAARTKHNEMIQQRSLEQYRIKQDRKAGIKA